MLFAKRQNDDTTLNNASKALPHSRLSKSALASKTITVLNKWLVVSRGKVSPQPLHPQCLSHHLRWTRSPEPLPSGLVASWPGTPPIAKPRLSHWSASLKRRSPPPCRSGHGSQGNGCSLPVSFDHGGFVERIRYSLGFSLNTNGPIYQGLTG